MSSKALNDSYVSAELGVVTHRSEAVPVVGHERERVVQLWRVASRSPHQHPEDQSLDRAASCPLCSQRQ